MANEDSYTAASLVQYLIAPLLTVVEGWVVFRPTLDGRTIVGVTLLGVSAYLLIRSEDAEPGDNVEASGAQRLAAIPIAQAAMEEVEDKLHDAVSNLRIVPRPFIA